MRASGISPGDEIFVMLSGSQAGRSLIGHGYATGSIFESPHPRNPAKLSNWVNVTWETWLDDEHGMPLTTAAEAAPNFYWRNPQGGGIRIEEGGSLREAWHRYLASLPETAFIAQLAQTFDPAGSRSLSAVFTVKVEFHEPVPVPDQRGDGTFLADRHYLDASSVHQDAHETIFVRSSGEITGRWPTSKIRSIEWLDPKALSRRQNETPAIEPPLTQEAPSPNPQQTEADSTGTPETLSMPSARAGES